MAERGGSWWIWVLIAFLAYGCWDDHAKKHKAEVEEAAADADYAEEQAREAAQASGNKISDLEHQVAELKDENAQLKSQVQQLQAQAH